MTGMLKKAFSVMAASLLACFLASGTAGAGDKIAVLVSSSTPPFEETLAGFRDYLARQGIRVEYEVYRLDGDVAQADLAVQKIKQGKARAILALGSLGMQAAAQNAPEIPVVSCLVLRPDTIVKAPNATGVGLEFPLETQFGWLKTILPRAKTIGVIYNPGENKKRVEDAARAARRLGLSLDAVAVYTPQDIPSALTALSRRVDALWGLADALTLSPQMAKHILLFAFRNKIPFVGPSDAWVRAGALYALDWDYSDLGCQCGEMAAQVLRGTPAKAIHSSTPRKVLYSVNLKTAEQIKVTISEQLAEKARNVY